MDRIQQTAAIFCLGIAFACEAGPASQPANNSPQQLIDMLGSPNFQLREMAQKALTGLGQTVLPILRRAQENADPEVRRRLNELVPIIERTAILTPKSVTLRLVNRPLNEAIAQIIKQTGYKIALHQQPNQASQLYSFHLEQVPFWEAFDKICETGNLTYQGNDEEGTFQLFNQGRFSPHVCRRGLFRFVAQNFQYTRTVDFSQVARDLSDPGRWTESLDFTFSVSTEPKLALLAVGSARLTSAYDDQKLSMVPQPPPANEMVTQTFFAPWMGRGGANFSQTAQINMAKPSRRSRTARVIRGSVPVTLLVDQRPEIVTDKILTSAGKKFKAGATAWSIENIVKGVAPNPGYQIKITVTDNRSGGLPNDENWINGLQQRVELRDSKERKYQMQGMQWENVSPTNVSGTLMFGNPGQGPLGPPTKLIYYTWITLQHQVAFEFANIPLP